MFIRFLIVGGLGFLIDLGVTQALIAAGVHAVAARPPAILLAMAFTWLAHRQYTYRVQARRSGSEALRFAAVSIVMSLLNLALYAALVLAGWNVTAAIVVATLLQAFLSFFGHRLISFRLGRGHAGVDNDGAGRVR